MPGQIDIWRQNWYGIKPYIKHLLGTRLINRPVLAILRLFPSIRTRIHRFPVGLPEVACHTQESTDFVMLQPLSCDVARELYWGGGWRGMPQDRVAALVFESLAKEATLVLDVGAYTGYFSLLAAKSNPVAEIIAFEIVPEVFLVLQQNIIRNDLIRQIDARLQGIGSDNSTMRIPLHLNSSVLPSSISKSYTFDSGVQIPFISLDHFSTSKPGRVLMKIDVEGSEDEVIGHGSKFIETYKPDMLCEILPQSKTEQFLMDHLRPLGYHFYSILDKGIEHRDVIKPDRYYKDWFLTPEPPIVFMGRVRT